MDNSSTNKNSLSGMLMLALCAFIWGTAFIAQSVGGEYAEPLTFNCSRSFLATIFLFCCCLLFDKMAGKPFKVLGTDDPSLRRRTIKGGIICGIALTLASFMQQLGIMYTTVGKSGFITALYIILVPLVGLFLKKRVGLNVWCGVALSLVGLYFLCMRGAAALNPGDLLTFGCAVFFTFHIVYIDSVCGALDGVRLSCIQFFTCSTISAVLMFALEAPTWQSIAACWLPIGYAGILSGGAGYTLQIIGQRNTPPVLASIIMSLESVFAALFGWLLIGQALSGWELLGCALMFAAIILAQLPGKRTVNP